eukprot:2358383-Pyramimonas_sp.AAC.1
MEVEAGGEQITGLGALDCGVLVPQATLWVGSWNNHNGSEIRPRGLRAEGFWPVRSLLVSTSGRSSETLWVGALGERRARVCMDSGRAATS